MAETSTPVKLLSLLPGTLFLEVPDPRAEGWVTASKGAVWEETHRFTSSPFGLDHGDILKLEGGKD